MEQPLPFYRGFCRCEDVKKNSGCNCTVESLTSLYVPPVVQRGRALIVRACLPSWLFWHIHIYTTLKAFLIIPPLIFYKLHSYILPKHLVNTKGSYIIVIPEQGYGIPFLSAYLQCSIFAYCFSFAWPYWGNCEVRKILSQMASWFVTFQ